MATLLPWAKGKPLAWDVTVQDTYAESHITDTVSTPGAAAHQAAQHSKILHTPMVVRSTLVGDLERDRHVGGSWPNQNVCFFVCNTCKTHPKSYKETTDRRDFGGKPSEWRCGRLLS